MKKIASFVVDHTKINPGMYISRIDEDIITYDLRMKKPNNGDYLDTGSIHTIEHLLATYVRNSIYSNSVVYAGPMGCRTGFYLLLTNNVEKQEAINLVKDSFKFIYEFEGDIPGVSEKECGNYKDHNLEGAKLAAREYYDVIKEWREEKLIYES